MNDDVLLRQWRERIRASLDRLLPGDAEEPARLHAAMRHAALPPGKCLRGMLVLACGRALGLAAERLDGAACALELAHAYSLVHDDLPCMDDSGTRRGRPACHKAHGVATAMLAGNALLLLALEALEDGGWPKARTLEACATLRRACGSRGMGGGQQLDLEWDGTGGVAQLEALYARKTGALIRAAAVLPARLGDADADIRARLDAFGEKVGLGFQIRDDLEDVGEAAAQPDVPCYAALAGEAAARARLAQLRAQALDSLRGFDARADALRELARRMTEPPAA